MRLYTAFVDCKYERSGYNYIYMDIKHSDIVFRKIDHVFTIHRTIELFKSYKMHYLVFQLIKA